MNRDTASLITPVCSGVLSTLVVSLLPLLFAYLLWPEIVSIGLWLICLLVGALSGGMVALRLARSPDIRVGSLTGFIAGFATLATAIFVTDSAPRVLLAGIGYLIVGTAAATLGAALVKQWWIRRDPGRPRVSW